MADKYRSLVLFYVGRGMPATAAYYTRLLVRASR